MKKAEFYKHIYKLGGNVTAKPTRHEMLKRLVLDFQPKKFLDIGCADGSFLRCICTEGMVCFGVDIKATEEDPMILRCDIDHEPIPFVAGKDFDVVFAGEIIEHVINPEHMLDEIRRVLAPDGHLVLTTPNLAAWYNRISLLLGYQPIFSGVGLCGTYGTLWPAPHPESHLRLYTLPALRGLVESRGFKVVRTIGVGINNSIGWGKKHPILTWIANRVFRSVGLSSNLVIIAEKR